MSYRRSNGIACILTSPITVQDRSVEPAILLSKLLNGIYAKLFLHIITHFKCDDFTVEIGENRRNIELSVRTLYLCNILQKLL